MNDGKREYPINGVEEDIIYCRDLYSYAQRSGLSKWVKRQINKRFRKDGKMHLQGLNPYGDTGVGF